MPELRDDQPTLPIGRVAALTGLTPRQIRYYEQQGLLQAARSAGGQRLYSRDQAQLLLLVKRLRDEGYSLAEVRGLLRQGGRGAEPARLPATAPAFRGEEPVSLYPMINRARLLEILDRLERRDRSRGPGRPE
jgi:DNA-binding transcriptional MerR regulator